MQTNNHYSESVIRLIQSVLTEFDTTDALERFAATLIKRLKEEEN